MFGYQLVMCDVDQQIGLEEGFDPCLGLHSGDNLESRRGDVDARDQNARVEVVRSQFLGKVAHVLDADGVTLLEFNVDGTNVRRSGFGVALSWGIAVTGHHFVTRACGEGHFGFAVECQLGVCAV